MKKNSFIEGTIIASIAIIFIKFLGAVYVIPFYKIIGEQGGTLYSYAYNIYNLFLNISIAGIPIAISKIISEYNAKNMYNTKEKAYKIGKYIMFAFAIITFLSMFIFSEEIATLILKGITDGNSITDVSFVIKVISFCLLIIPSLSVTKGYLQGHKFITSTSISQVIEQIVRIFIVLLGSYLAIKVFNKSITVGVGVALSGAFIGGLIALIYLRIKIKNNKDAFKCDKEDKTIVETKEIIRKIIKYSIPLIIVATATNLYDTTNMILVLRGLTLVGYDASSAEIISSIITTWGTKICMIINSIAMGLSINIIPHMVTSYINKDYKDANSKFSLSVQTIIAITIPMAIGLSFLAKPIYEIFYGESIYGQIILRYLAFVSVFASIHIVINMALQGLNKFKTIYLNTFVGLIINVILNIPLTLLFNKIGIYPYYGAITSTLIGYTVSFIIVFITLKKDFSFNYKDISITIKKMILPLLAMIICLIGLNLFISLDSTSTIKLVLKILLFTLVGATPFFIISYKNGLLYDVFGKDYIDKILKKLKLKK